jgi:hypothetical protein
MCPARLLALECLAELCQWQDAVRQHLDRPVADLVEDELQPSNVGSENGLSRTLSAPRLMVSDRV